MAHPVSPLAKRVLPLVDLTELAPAATLSQIEAFCEKARALPVHPAAVCVRPEFVARAKAILKGTAIKVATVINFPTADVSTEQRGANVDVAAQVQETRAALELGADEIDLVFAWKAYHDGDHDAPLQVVAAVKEAGGEKAKLKLILESGGFIDMTLLRKACDAAIDAGVDFLKTSTGFHATGATPMAARVLCEASKAVGKMVGVKISGGVRTAEQAMQYIDIAADVLGANWVEPGHFRIGASKLVDALLTPATTIDKAAGY